MRVHGSFQRSRSVLWLATSSSPTSLTSLAENGRWLLWQSQILYEFQLSRINSPHIKIFSPNIRLHSDKLDSHLVCSECLLFVCSETTERSCWRRVLRYNAALFEWDSEWSVLIYFVILNSVEMTKMYITPNYQFISGFEAKWDQQLFCHVMQEFYQLSRSEIISISMHCPNWLLLSRLYMPYRCAFSQNRHRTS